MEHLPVVEGKEKGFLQHRVETTASGVILALSLIHISLVDMISGMDVKEDDESYMNAVDYMFKGLEKRKPDCFAVKQYKKYKLASGVVISMALLPVPALT